MKRWVFVAVIVALIALGNSCQMQSKEEDKAMVNKMNELEKKIADEEKIIDDLKCKNIEAKDTITKTNEKMDKLNQKIEDIIKEIKKLREEVAKERPPRIEPPIRPIPPLQPKETKKMLEEQKKMLEERKNKLEKEIEEMDDGPKKKAKERMLKSLKKQITQIEEKIKKIEENGEEKEEGEKGNPPFKFEFRGPDGKLLPPEQEEKLRKQFKFRFGPSPENPDKEEDNDKKEY